MIRMFKLLLLAFVGLFRKPGTPEPAPYLSPEWPKPEPEPGPLTFSPDNGLLEALFGKPEPIPLRYDQVQRARKRQKAKNRALYVNHRKASNRLTREIGRYYARAGDL